MTRFGKRSLIWLVVGSFVAAAGVLAWHTAVVGAQQTHDLLQQVARSENDLATFKTRFSQWKKTLPPETLAGMTDLHPPRVEPVALNADFSPREFSGIGLVLADMYTEHGSLKLKSFNLEVGAGGTAHVTVLGEKVFVQ